MSLTLTDKHVPLSAVAGKHLPVVLQHGLQTGTAAHIVPPVPPVVAQLLAAHPLPVLRAALPMEAEPKAGCVCGSGIEERRVLLFGARDGEVHVVPLAKPPGFEPRHRPLEQGVLRDDVAHC